ncbi:MAG TPA: S8 family peptidase, partial [Gemmataceae bacterium]|nr:S8 family peptidase [Gemmataceae bacterium]
MLRRRSRRHPFDLVPAARPILRARRTIRIEPLEERAVPAIVPFDALAVDRSSYDSSTILVRLQPGPIDPNALGIPGAVGARPLALVPGLWQIELGAGSSAATALTVSQASPVVQFASFNYRLRLSQIPNDPGFADQWGLNNTGQTGGTPDADIDAPEAWDIFTGSSSTIVAVIDTGVDYNHPDLAANMWTNPGEIPGNGIDDDGNGYVDDVHGYDFVNNDGDPMDDHNHGTHVAGIIGAVGNNNLGVTGINWNVRIMAVKCFDSSGNGTVANAILGLNYAVQMGAKISNNSYGSAEPDPADPLFEEAIRNAANVGHIFVAAAGNNSSNNDLTGHFPSGFDSDNIVSVAATDANDQLAFFSDYGPTTVDLAAPGVDILSTLPHGQYGTYSGTSMATPQVTGVVALVRGLHPDWTYRQVIDQVLNSVDYVPGLEGRVATSGRLNAARALFDVDGPRVVSTDPAGQVGGVVSRVRVF